MISVKTMCVATKSLPMLSCVQDMDDALHPIDVCVNRATQALIVTSLFATTWHHLIQRFAAVLVNAWLRTLAYVGTVFRARTVKRTELAMVCSGIATKYVPLMANVSKRINALAMKDTLASIVS